MKTKSTAAISALTLLLAAAPAEASPGFDGLGEGLAALSLWLARPGADVDPGQLARAQSPVVASGEAIADSTWLSLIEELSEGGGFFDQQGRGTAGC